MTRIGRALPHLVGLVVAGGLFHWANQIQYVPRGDALGPDFWPKLAIGLMALVCAVESVRAMLGAVIAHGISDVLSKDEVVGQRRYVHLLAGGIALILGYAVLVPVVGFLPSSMLFMGAFMYLGRYRNHIAIWAISGTAMLILAFLFLRFAYVSLPRGIPPFDRFTDVVHILVGG